jgi:hypothetical protein
MASPDGVAGYSKAIMVWAVMLAVPPLPEMNW